MKGNVFITGASRGIGKALSFRFAREGYDLVMGSRDENLLRDVAGDISGKYGVRTLPLRLDVTSREDCERFVEVGVREIGKPDVLINNAGIGLYDSFEGTREEDIRRLFEVNFFGLLNITKYALPYLKESRGTIINISSMAGRLPLPFMGIYSASKGALNLFSEALRDELKREGVHVLLVLPGSIRTGFSERAMGSLKPPSSFGSKSSEELADAIYRAFKKKKRELVYPWWGKLVIFVQRLLPGLYDYFVLREWEGEKGIK
jgi:short-subunit dehydrogenase